MPRARKGPSGPKSSLAGKRGTNKMAKGKGSGGSHHKQIASRTKGRY